MNRDLRSLEQQLNDILLLLRYAAPQDRQQAAETLVRRYADDQIALRLLHAFYSFLPEGEDDVVKRLALVASRQGCFLLRAETIIDHYLYLVTSEQARFLGPHSQGIDDEELLAFFGWRECRDFLARHRPSASYPEYSGRATDLQACPVCAVTAGEEHHLGCPIEICPWCGGQLTACNCRFDQLGVTAISTDRQIEELYEKLQRIGRIPFDPQEQSLNGSLEIDALLGDGDSRSTPDS